MTLNDSHGHVDWVLKILKLLLGIGKMIKKKKTRKENSMACPGYSQSSVARFICIFSSSGKPY